VSAPAQSSDQLYQARVPIFPRSVSGRYRTIKWAVLVFAYGVYFLLPWLRWERPSGPTQAVLFDIVGRKFYVFDLVVYAQDIFWLAGVLVIGAFLLFFVTGLAGRVFCGYFCFQTLWTDVFVLIERIVQGERPARMRLAKAAWGREKALKLGLTHLLWLAVALLTGTTFTLYWGNAPDMVGAMVTGEGAFPAYATTLFLTATTYVMAGLAREQVCTYMCPYSRFQSVMFDQDTLIIAYDRERGERRAGRHKPASGLKTREERMTKGYGDCIDCGYCVQVCPTGIDIRNGLQVQCISCALCVDACNTIMESIGYPRGLVRYSSERALAGGKTKLLKLKHVGYGIGVLIAIALLSFSVATRSTVDVSVVQVRQPLAVTLSDGRIQNQYEVKIMNKTNVPARFAIHLAGLAGAQLDLGHFTELSVGAGSSVRVLARVRMDPHGATQSKQPFEFVVERLDNDQIPAATWQAVFYTPPEKLEVHH